jgi:hypothetical protein
MAIALHVPPDVAQARIDETLAMAGVVLTYRHAIGPALEDVLRQTLQQGGRSLVRQDSGPPFAAAAFAQAPVIVVPGQPVITGAYHEKSVVTMLTQTMSVPLSVHRADGSVKTLTAQATLATGAYGPLFTNQKTMDEFLLRNLAASALISLGAQLPDAVAGHGPAAGPSSGVAVLRLDAGLAQRDGIEGRVEQCLREAFPAPAAEASAAALRDALFPWLEPGIAPRTEAALHALLEQPAVQQRLALRGIGWLVLFTAVDAPSAKKENMLCGGGFGAGACFGLYSARSGYTVDMAVWNVRAAAPAAKVQASVMRTIGAVGLILPIPFMTSNATEACTLMQEFVRQSIAAGANPTVPR